MKRNPSRREFVRSNILAAAAWSVASRRDSFGQAPEQRFELSLHQYSLRPLFESHELKLIDYPRFVKTRFGISNIEFAAEFCTHLLTEHDAAEAIRRRSQQNGVRNQIVLCGNRTALDAADAKQRAVAIEEHVRWSGVAERLGCKFIRVRASRNGQRRQQLEHATAGLRGLCDALASSSVSVLVENIGGWSRKPDWLVELVKRVGEERIGLVADFGNFDGDLYAGMKTILPYAKSICTKSWQFDDAGNETKIDFARMMSLINESNYRGCIAIEYLGPEPVAGIRKTAALVQRFADS